MILGHYQHRGEFTPGFGRIRFYLGCGQEILGCWSELALIAKNAPVQHAQLEVVRGGRQDLVDNRQCFVRLLVPEIGGGERRAIGSSGRFRNGRLEMSKRVGWLPGSE